MIAETCLFECGQTPHLPSELCQTPGSVDDKTVRSATVLYAFAA